MIKLQIIGHIGKDATVNNVNGKNVINFHVAHSEKYKDASGTEINKTTWVDCAYWADRTAVAQYLKSGTQVFVEGQPDIRQCKANDGTNRANITLRVNNIQLLGGGKKEENAPTPSTNNAPANIANDNQPPIGEDDLPF